MTPTPVLHGTTQWFARECDELIRSRYALVAVETFEEPRFLGIIHAVLDAQNKRAVLEDKPTRELTIWSRTRGLVTIGGLGLGGRPKAIPETQDPLSALEHIARATQGIFVLCDFRACLEDPMSGPLVVRLLRELGWAINGSDPTVFIPRARPVTVFLVDTYWPPLPALQKELKLTTMPLPGADELREMVEGKVEELGGIPEATVEVDETLTERLARALLGLSEQEADNALARAVTRCRGLSSSGVKVVLDEKASIIRAVPGLSYEEPEAIDALGGYRGAREFFADAEVSNQPEALADGVEPNKGALLVGLPGCGKDHSVKVCAGVMQRPLLKLSMSAIMSAGGGILGQAEGTMKRVIQMCDIVKPILHISEFEKVMSGLKSSGQTDGGTTARLLGEFIDWMAEQSGTFVLATANSIEGLEPEQFRTGRFGGLLFYDLPNRQEREEILAVHLRRKRREPGAFGLREVAEATEGYSGAELKQVVENSLLLAYKARHQLTTLHLLSAVPSVRPLSKVASERIDQVRAWARTHDAKLANSPVEVEEEAAPVSRRRRPVEI